jgi:CRP/FNR family cyclic AMP-dependent transcriptional regulator
MMVRVLDEDPSLAAGLPARERPAAVAAAIAPLVRADVTKSLALGEPAAAAHLGFLVLDGLLARHVAIGQIGSTEFFGTGDLLLPGVPLDDGSHTTEVRWEALAPARLAALDHDFARRIRSWPEIPAALLARSAARADAQLLQSALRHAARIENRVLLALWHFAGRWGHVSTEGRVVSLPNIPHEVLARVVGARRQSVTTALGRLRRDGAIERREDGCWVIRMTPVELVGPSPAPSGDLARSR